MKITPKQTHTHNTHYPHRNRRQPEDTDLPRRGNTRRRPRAAGRSRIDLFSSIVVCFMRPGSRPLNFISRKRLRDLAVNDPLSVAYRCIGAVNLPATTEACATFAHGRRRSLPAYLSARLYRNCAS